jgi:lipopolysaccharide transport system ATP-binding protein
MSIVFDGVWKQFQRGELHDSLRDLVPAITRGIFGRGKPKDGRVFWALKNISFQVSSGQALGILGANGAGKSTILKILTRILEPTRGQYRVDGRVGALLEIGAGFHPDLTGRENVFLQGTIMGMRNREIRSRFDEIVEFSGIADFIDTPVKRYSSGMTTRLGFAIAAHLDAEVLIIDEVLAVGDYAYQQKAFDRIHALATSGIPVVLVSHQLDRITALCTHALLLDHGEIRRTGTPEECIAEYITAGGSGLRQLRGDAGLPLELTAVRALTEGPVRSGESATIRLQGKLLGALPPSLDPVAVRLVSTVTGLEVFATSAHECGLTPPSQPGPFEVELILQLNVRPGIYLLESAVVDWTRWLHLASGPHCYLHVIPGDPFRGQIQMHARMRMVPPSGP